MNTNTENKNELATPIIFGTAIATLCAPFGPIVAMVGFAVGAGLGYWSDKKDAASVKSQEKAPLEGAVKKSICH